jgi:hypothetical protein
MRWVLLLLLIAVASTAMAGSWSVRKDADADTYGVYEGSERRGTLQRDSGSTYIIYKDPGEHMGSVQKDTPADSFDVGGVRQDPNAKTFGVFDPAGNRLGTILPDH